MVKKKSGRILNPADAHRKAMRQKEIKKNKAERRRVRTLVMVHKDTSKLEEEVTRYRALDREKRLDKNGKAKLKDLEEKLKKILETKKAHGVNLQKEKEKTTKEHVPVYFHPTLNPSGLPPPGVSIEDEKEGSFEDDSGSEFSDNDSEAEAKQESDEDIPLPPGSPPTKESDDELPELPPGPPPNKEESDDDDDELPDLPPGPPPINISSYSPLMARPSHPSPFGFNHQGSPFPPPPGTFVFNGPLGSPNHQRPNMRTPPHPTFGPGPIPFSRGPPPPPTATMHPIQGQGYPVRSLDAPHLRPPPFSSQVSHYGPPPQIPGGNNNISSRTFSPSISNNAQLAKASAATATPIIQAAPQVRNLQKELTTLIPTALLRKRVAASKPKVAIPVVNAAPKIDDGLISELSTATPTKRSAPTTIHLLQEQKSSEVDTSQSNGGMISNNAQLAKSSAATATPIIQAAPQVRNLQKELTTLIPTALLRKKVAASKPKVAIPVVNAAPKIDDGLISELPTVTPTKRSASTTIHLLQEQKSSEVDTSQSNGGMISNSAPPPTKKAKKKKADEYEKFMAEMQDLL